jgi:dTMP kinase
MKNLFITFEGGEGCGKSTHSRLLKRYLESKGYKVVLTFEPGGTHIGRFLRKMLLKGAILNSRYSELLLFAADRAEHVKNVIMPALNAGTMVICDRFIDSTTAYQQGGRKIDKTIVRLINKLSSGGLVPDITFLLDVEPKIGIRRGTRHTGKDKFESENGGFHRRVRSTYLNIAKSHPKRVKVISSNCPVEEVQKMIRKLMDEKLGN